MSLWRDESNEETLPTTTDRTYITITPAEEPLDPRTIESGFERLHQLEPERESTWLPDFLTGTPKPTIEWLLVATDDTIDYTVSIDPPELIDGLEHVLRDILPTSYELTRTDVHPAVELLYDEPPATAVEFYGQPDRPRDWQTRLTPFQKFQSEDGTNSRVPLSALVETLATTDAPTAVQVLAQPYSNWTHEASYRQQDIQKGTDTRVGRLSQTIFGIAENYEPSPGEQQRLDELDAKNARRSFVVTVRVLQYDQPDTAASDLQSAFGHVGHTTYEITGKQADDPTTVHDDLQERTVHQPDYDTRLPFKRPQSRGIVADPAELGSFCLVDGSALTGEGKRAIAPTHGERTAIPSPPEKRLDRYRTSGLTLGTPITQDGTPMDDPVALPPELQPLHTAWFGKTGSGKSTALVTAVLDNHAATDGADILIDPKGDGMPEEYMRAHHERFGNLENVIYFDCEEVLPAFSFFDIRDDLAAGVDRTNAVEQTVDHYLEILTQIMGRDRFEQAVRSPDIIRYLAKAMFDPVSGDDAFTHREFHAAVREMHERQTAPPVVDEDLERMLAGVAANTGRTFDELMQGVANRIEKIPADRRLARIFNHVPDEDDPHFDLGEYLNEDVVVIVDTGGLRDEAQRVLALVVLSNLWSALQRRTARGDGDQPLVNCYVDEAASIAVSDLLTDLLAQSRGFHCALTLLMQFPAQLRSQSQEAYDEVLNNVSTMVTGNVAVDQRLARRLATADMDTEAVGNRLRALRRGQWLVTLPAPFDETEPRPFQVVSADPPRGHPASDHSVSRPGLERALDDVIDRTRETAGVTLTEPSPVDEQGDPDDSYRIDTALPHTSRLPPTVRYEVDTHALHCTECDARYDPDSDGMVTAIECCSSLDAVDPDDVPVCDLDLKLGADERAASEWSDNQLMFLQAVYNAQQQRYEPPAYDLLSDSMIRLQEYVDVDSEAIQDLIDAGLLTKDTDRPHRLYSVTPAGRRAIGERHRKGIDFGHGLGDLDETSHHVLAVEVGRRYLEAVYRQDPDSPVKRVVPYYELDGGDRSVVPASLAMGDEDLTDAADEYDHRRLDVVGLDGDDEVVVTVEAERINHDHRRAVPADYDKMAECDPDEAIWIATSHDTAHDILQALNDPLDGDPRVEKTYAESTPADQFRIDQPGCTAMYTVSQVQKLVADAQDGE